MCHAREGAFHLHVSPGPGGGDEHLNTSGPSSISSRGSGPIRTFSSCSVIQNQVCYSNDRTILCVILILYHLFSCINVMCPALLPSRAKDLYGGRSTSAEIAGTTKCCRDGRPTCSIYQGLGLTFHFLFPSNTNYTEVIQIYQLHS